MDRFELDWPDTRYRCDGCGQSGIPDSAVSGTNEAGLFHIMDATLGSGPFMPTECGPLHEEPDTPLNHQVSHEQSNRTD